MLKVLVAEDDVETRDYLERGLRELGHAVSTTGDGRDALFLATSESFDAIILGRMLPGIDGMTILRSIRGVGVSKPVLMLTALARVEDRVEGLEAGADDYLVKPFAFTVLTARLNALSRRLERSRTTPGHGLGLSLVAAITKVHGGTVCLDDNYPGVKAMVTIPRRSE